MAVHLRTWTRRVLLAFVFVTIGFGLGRHTAERSQTGADESAKAATQPSAGEDKVIVYSAHMTFRCWECNQIEFLTKELLEKDFSEQMEAGLIEYRSVDYMKDADFAGRYDIASSTVVLARFEDGREVGFERLDEVWTKARNKEEFLSYVRGELQAQLEQLAREDS
ncbi:MAG: nitrophenyl compound nitroreductase subunit ArsF family protein [Phycisphaerae bacterium]